MDTKTSKSDQRALSYKKLLWCGWMLMCRSWRPMALYTFIVWAGCSVLLTPLTTWVLHHLTGFGDVIVGNYSIHLWLLTPKGIIYLLIAGSVILFTIILHATGLFLIANSSRKAVLSAKQALGEVLRSSHGLLRLSTAVFIVCLPFVLLVVAGPIFAKRILLSEHDINYYLTRHPSEWFIAIGVATLWVLPLLCSIIFIFVRWIYVLPAWLEGERPILAVMRLSWHATAGKFWSLFRLITSCVGAWIVFSLLIDLILFTLSKFLLFHNSDSLGKIILIASSYLISTAIMDGILGFIASAWGVCIWIQCYNRDFNKEHDKSIHLTNPKKFNPITATVNMRNIRISLIAVTVLMISSFIMSIWIFRQEIPSKLPIVIAHRAGATDAPENTLSGLRKVLQDKATDIVEIDVTLTLDGELVVTHDKDLMKQAGDPRIIAETKYKDIADVDIGASFHKDFKGERLGRLDEFLEATGKRIPMIIEFKHGKDTDLVEKTIQMVRAHNMQDNVILMSLELDEVRKVQELAPEIKAGYFASVEVGDLTELNVYCIGAKDQMTNPKFIRDIQEQGMLIYTWTIDDPLRMIELIDAGVDGIITNDPLLARKVISKVHTLPSATRILLRFRKFWGVFDEMGWLAEAPVHYKNN